MRSYGDKGIDEKDAVIMSHNREHRRKEVYTALSSQEEWIRKRR